MNVNVRLKEVSITGPDWGLGQQVVRAREFDYELLLKSMTPRDNIPADLLVIDNKEKGSKHFRNEVLISQNQIIAARHISASNVDIIVIGGRRVHGYSASLAHPDNDDNLALIATVSPLEAALQDATSFESACLRKGYKEGPAFMLVYRPEALGLRELKSVTFKYTKEGQKKAAMITFADGKWNLSYFTLVRSEDEVYGLGESGNIGTLPQTFDKANYEFIEGGKSPEAEDEIRIRCNTQEVMTKVPKYVTMPTDAYDFQRSLVGTDFWDRTFSSLPQVSLIGSLLDLRAQIDSSVASEGEFLDNLRILNPRTA